MARARAGGGLSPLPTTPRHPQHPVLSSPFLEAPPACPHLPNCSLWVGAGRASWVSAASSWDPWALLLTVESVATKGLSPAGGQAHVWDSVPSWVKTRKKGCPPPPHEAPRIQDGASSDPLWSGVSSSRAAAQSEAGLSPKCWPVLGDVLGGSSPLPMPQLLREPQVSALCSMHVGERPCGVPAPQVSTLPLYMWERGRVGPEP